MKERAAEKAARPEAAFGLPMKESYHFTDKRQVLIEEQLDVSGLVLLGHQVLERATLPLASHCHPGCMEFVLMMKGEESYSVDGRHYELKGGDVFVSFVGQPHQSSKPYQGVSEIIWFQINPAVEGDFLGLSPQFAQPLRQKLLSLDQHVFTPGAASFSLARRCLDAFVMGKEFPYCLALFHHLLAELLYEGGPQQRAEDIEKARQYIDLHLDETLPMEQLCAIAGLSLSGFKHKFKLLTGHTPRDYVNYQKIQRAKQLLAQGESVTRTAMLLGFNSSDYFSVVFKRYTRLPPSHYQRSVRQEGSVAPSQA